MCYPFLTQVGTLGYHCFLDFDSLWSSVAMVVTIVCRDTIDCKDTIVFMQRGPGVLHGMLECPS